MHTGVGEVRLVALDLVGDVFLALSELLHVVGDDGLAACGCHIVLNCCWFSVS